MLTLGGLAGGVRFALRPAMICVRLQFGYRFMNRMKPASDTNMPEGTVMDLRSARHLPPFSAESRHREGDDGYQSEGRQWGSEEFSYKETKHLKTCCSPSTCKKVEDTRLPSPSLISYTPLCLEVSLAMTTSLMVPFLPREMRPL